MKLIDYVLAHKSFFWMLMLAVVIGGVAAYFELGRLEYPNFTIKKATVATFYPGASAQEVEREVTDRIEEEIQKMSQIKNITSISRSGFSLIYVEIRPEYTTSEMPQIWDELRRKVNDIHPSLPTGVSASKVGDDFGDVYGVFLSLSGKGYTPDELKDYADVLKKEILRIKDVSKVAFWGVPEKRIYVEVNRAKLSNLPVLRDDLFPALGSNNMVEEAGAVGINDEYCTLRVSGGIDGVAAIRNLLAADSAGRLIRLGDLAEVRRGHKEPATQIMRFNGEPAIGIGVSTVEGGNVVAMGKAIRRRLSELEASRPVGMNVDTINFQSDDVENSLNDFLLNLLESVLIVIGILLFCMGWRSGLVIGITLLLIILGTFMGMRVMGIDMQLVSLGALIIALGMLVDNAIVIDDGYLVKTSRGKSPEDALKEVIAETQWPLLGATIVAILAFLAVGFNPGNIGEFCRSLFYVIAISLFLSWLMALTFTPLLCLWLIPVRPGTFQEERYDGRAYRCYRSFLEFCLKHRRMSMTVMFLLLGASIIGYFYVPKSFFPDSTRPQFYIDYWRNPASHIDETASDAAEIAAFLRRQPGVKSATVFAGEGALRFILSYDYNSPSPDYAQILVETENVDQIPALADKSADFIAGRFPGADAMVQRFTEGIAIPFKFEARFRGPDRAVLRQLAEEAKTVIRNAGNIKYLRDDWRAPVKAVRVRYSEAKARKTGISRKDLAQAMQWNFNGSTCGVLREKNDLIPIVSRPVASERRNMTELSNVQVWSQAARRSYSLAQAADGVETIFEDVQIRHRDRVPTITVQCSPRNGTAAELQKVLEPELRKIALPPLYSLEFGGEYEERMTAESGLKTLFPLSLALMFILVATLFRTIRESLVAFFTLPFALTGVVAGLLLMDLPFGFMAILGFLGLSGMLLKNAIVLLDEIARERSNGSRAYDAVVNSSVSRLRPVAMAAGTTVFGVAPLLGNAFYASMAATIMYGLLGATILALILVPLWYVVIFRVDRPEKQSECSTAAR